MIIIIPGLLAFIFGWFAFRSRVSGVYFSIITQALTNKKKMKQTNYLEAKSLKP